MASRPRALADDPRVPEGALAHTQEREIGGRVWLAGEFLGTQGLDLMFRVTDLLAPAIGALDVADLSNVGRALRGVGLTKPETMALIKDLLRTTRVQVDGGKWLNAADHFDLLFRGAAGLETLFQVLRFVVEANLVGPLLSSTISALRVRAGDAAEKLRSLTPSASSEPDSDAA